MAFNMSWNFAPHNIVVQILSNLSPTSRAQASATCKSWREAYFSPCLWNDIQLCYDPTDGWQSCKKFVSCCGKAFRQVAIFPFVFRLNIFDEEGCLLYDAANKYKKAVRELPELLDLMTNSTFLQRLRIKFPDDVMGSWGDYHDINFFSFEVLERIWQSVYTILKSSSSMEHLELGFQIDILGYRDRLQVLKDTCSQSLKTLHCMVVDLVFDERVMSVQPSVEHLMTFTRLKEINLNISYVTDDLLEALSAPGHCQMDKIVILCTGIEKTIEDDNWTSDTSWQKIKAHSPGLKISICLYWPGINIFKFILKPVIPLCSLSVMCDVDQQLHPMFVDHMTYSKETLVNLELHTFAGMPLFQLERAQLDSRPLLALAEHCFNLKKLIITGGKLFYEDIISIAETRNDLAILDIAHDSIVYTDPERGDRLDASRLNNRDGNLIAEEDTRKITLIDRVSHAFKKKWTPMNREVTALSYWAFCDNNLLPYEIIDENDTSILQIDDRKWTDNDEGTSTESREIDGNTRRQSRYSDSDNAKNQVHSADGHGQQRRQEDSDEDRDEDSNVHNKRRQYKEYNHAVHLAPGPVACKVKPAFIW